LRKDLDARDLLMLGVGGVIGGGVFVLTGAAAHDHAGPAVLISYLVASATSAVTGLCYTEFACEAPVAGSSYVYVSMCFGEFAGYLCGCNLGLELTISAAAVARGWTSYVATLFRAPPDALRVRVGGPSNPGGDGSDGDASGGVALDLPAAFVVAFITCVLVCGMKDSARFNTAVTAVSLAVIAFVLVAGGAKVDADNWRPFAPNGVDGILAGASVVFFSFVGFDTVATCAEECADPGRDLPVGILGSLGVCAALYAAMCLVVTGMTPSRDIDVEAPFAVAFKARGMAWAESVISLGALAAITTALLSSLMGQPRVYMVMARDGLLPKWFAAVHPKFGTPANASAFTGITTGLLALVVDIETLAELVSIGTLAVFGSVCASLLRRNEPTKGFKTPFVPYVPAIGVAACTQLVFSLGPPAWVRFGAYTVLCAGFYAARGLVGDRL
ncbi:amino acid-polyamine-organocation family, partial [Micromonas commoda]